MIEFDQKILEHFAGRFGLLVDDINLSEIVSQQHDILKVVEDHQEWFDTIYPNRIGEIPHGVV